MASGVQEALNGEIRLAYETRGAGEPLLLVQGLGYGRWGWDAVAGLLARKFRVIVFDNRGIGDSDVPPGPYSVRQLAADAVAVLDAERVERAHVVGASLGGMVAQELAISHAERVDRLVLVCTTPGGLATHSVPQATLDLVYAAPDLEPDEALRRGVEIGLGHGTAEARPDLFERIVELRNAHSFDLAGWWAQALAGASFDAYDRLGRVCAPTLVLTGTADSVVDCRNSEILAELVPGARLERFPDCGHLLFWEEPERFAKAVTAFLLRPSRNGRGPYS